MLGRLIQFHSKLELERGAFGVMIMFPEYNNTFSDNSMTNSTHDKCEPLALTITTYLQGLISFFLLPYMVLITHGTKDSLAAELFHLSMAICETLFLLEIPLHLSCLLDPAGGNVALTLRMRLWALIWYGRPLFQCSIIVERYLAVVHPLTFIS